MVILPFSKFFGLKSEPLESTTFSPTSLNSGLYNNTNCGISLQSPVNWTVIKHADEKLNKIQNDLLSASPSLHSLSVFELSILDISNSLIYPTKSLDEVVDFEIDYIKTVSTSDTIETIERTQVSGYPARLVIYSEDFKTLHNTIMKLWVVVSGKAYQITFDAPKKEYTQYLPVVQEIIESIRLDNPTSCEVRRVS